MNTRDNKGFSLIELLIVVAIILIIAAVAIPNLLRARIAANEASAAQSLRQIILPISQASGEHHPAFHLPQLLAWWITCWLQRYPEAEARAVTCLPPQGLRLVV